MKYGAGVVAARQHGAAEIVDPRPWAIGTIDETFRKYDVGPVLPAMGYSDEQLAEMEKIIDTADADLVVIGTPIDLRRVIDDLEAGRPGPLRPRGPPGLADAHRRPGAGPRGLIDHRKRGDRGGTGRHRARRQRLAPPRRGGHVRGDVPGLARGRGADRRHRRRGVGGRRHARQRPAGRQDPAPAGGREGRRAPDAARRVRRGEPGPDRLPVAGDDRGRVLRTRDGAAGRDHPDAHARAPAGSRVPQPDEVRRPVLRGGRGRAPRAGARAT